MSKIGASTAIDTGRENWERMQDLVNENFKHLEVYNKLTRVRLRDVKPIKEVCQKKGISFSLHSMVQDLFCDDKHVAMQEYYTLKGEIKLASLMDFVRVIFHIGKKTALDEKQEESLKKLARFAKTQGIDLVLENNPSGPLSGEYLLELKEKIPELKFCIDIGHLNIAINKGLVKDKDGLIRSLSKKIVELHINYNNGKKDEHREIDKDSIGYLKEISSLLDSNPDYIIETKNIDQARKTLDILDKRK